MNKSSLSIFAFLTASVSGGCLANDATQQCENVYKDNMSQYNTNSQIAFAIEKIASAECSKNETDLKASYGQSSNSLIDSLSGVAKSFFGSYNNKNDFCRDYRSGKLAAYSSFSYEKKPLQDMATQFNSCMQIASSYNYAVWSSSNGPSEVVFHGQYFFSGMNKFTFDVSANYQGSECFTPEENREEKFINGSLRQVTNQFTMTCRRTGTDNEISTFYRAANVMITFNGQPYPITMNADRVFFEPGDGPKSSEEARKMSEELRSLLASEKKSNSDLENELNKEKNKKYVTWLAYAGEHDGHMPGTTLFNNTVPKDPLIPVAMHFSCGFKSRLDGRNEEQRIELGKKISTAICGTKENKWIFAGHEEGNECGYDAYVVNCEI